MTEYFSDDTRKAKAYLGAAVGRLYQMAALMLPESEWCDDRGRALMLAALVAADVWLSGDYDGRLQSRLPDQPVGTPAGEVTDPPDP